MGRGHKIERVNFTQFERWCTCRSVLNSCWFEMYFILLRAFLKSFQLVMISYFYANLNLRQSKCVSVINPIFVLFIIKNRYRNCMCFLGNKAAIFYRLKILNLLVLSQRPNSSGFFSFFNRAIKCLLVYFGEHVNAVWSLIITITAKAWEFGFHLFSKIFTEFFRRNFQR